MVVVDAEAVEQVLSRMAATGEWRSEQVRHVLRGLVRHATERCARRLLAACERFPDDQQIQCVLRREAEDMLEGT